VTVAHIGVIFMGKRGMKENRWTREETALLEVEFPHKPTPLIVGLFPGRSITSIRTKAAGIGLSKSEKGRTSASCYAQVKRRGLRSRRRAWTTQEIQYLQRMYPTRTALQMAVELKRSQVTVRWQLHRYGIQKARLAK
jgi:hypothetical protein